MRNTVQSTTTHDNHQNHKGDTSDHPTHKTPGTKPPSDKTPVQNPFVQMRAKPTAPIEPSPIHHPYMITTPPTTAAPTTSIPTCKILRFCHNSYEIARTCTATSTNPSAIPSYTILSYTISSYTNLSHGTTFI